MNFLSDDTKRKLTLNWNRHYIDDAKSIVQLFENLPPKLKHDQNLCLTLINGKWNAFFDVHPPSNDSFARRLYYVIHKFEERKNLNEDNYFSKGNGFFLSKPKIRDSIIDTVPATTESIDAPKWL